eukprot:scaffold3895_cov97-Alexandrium_tamarense.AAC.6
MSSAPSSTSTAPSKASSSALEVRARSPPRRDNSEERESSSDAASSAAPAVIGGASAVRISSDRWCIITISDRRLKRRRRGYCDEKVHPFVKKLKVNPFKKNVL